LAPSRNLNGDALVRDGIHDGAWWGALSCVAIGRRCGELCGPPNNIQASDRTVI